MAQLANEIVLGVKGVDIRFRPTLDDYNKFINEMQMTNKVAPANNYVRRIVNKDDRAALDEVLIQNPGAALQLASKVNDEFAPELDIVVKK